MRCLKKTAAEIFDAAESNGARRVEETDINGDPVRNVYQPGTEVNYVRMMNLWDEYVRRYPDATPQDLRTFKHFVDYCVRGWNATQRICREAKQRKKIAYTTVRQRITEFLAAWQCRPGNQKIQSEVSKSIYNHMKTPKFQVTVSPVKRERHYLTLAYYRILMEHMWTKDWYQYDHGGTQINDYALHTFSIYSSSRVGEWIESSARKDSGRGLLYKDVNFVVFRNERGKAETAICPKRDAKGMTTSPEGRPQHGMYEDIQPLFACAMLPTLAIAVANDAFQDYHSFDEIFAISPPRAGTVHPLRIKEEMLEMPFFQTFTKAGPTGATEKAIPFSNRTVNLGHRAGFKGNITMHSERREVLVKAAASGYVKDDRKKLAGHRCNAFLSSYASSISTIDGAASFWGLKPRTSHLEAFRGLSLQWHPQMEQSLPAKVQDDLAQRPDFVAISRDIRFLSEKLKDLITQDEIKTTRSRRDELYFQRRQLMSDELNRWQSLQSRKVTDDNSHVASRPSFFNRVRRLDPPRDRLASTLFLDVPLRSEKGRSALRDMITLYKENPQVAYRPSLGPINGRCPVTTCEQDMETFVIRYIEEYTCQAKLTQIRIQVANRWDHIFRCHTKQLELAFGFAELCFQCDLWVTNAVHWHAHCQGHVDDYATIPVQFNQVKFRYTPATAAQCPFCLFNSTLPAPLRWRQYKNTQDWKVHVNKHFSEGREYQLELDEDKALTCPDPRCGLSFDTIGDLQYHCQDTQCLNLVKYTPCQPASSGALIMKGSNSGSLRNRPGVPSQVEFVDETSETVSSLCVDLNYREVESRERRKRGRPRKQRSVLPQPVVAKDRPCQITKRGKPKIRCNERLVAPLSTGPKCELRWKKRRGRPNKSGSASSAASSSRTPSPQSYDSHDLESESEPEDVGESAQEECEDQLAESAYETYGVGKKRKRKGVFLEASSTMSSSPASEALGMLTSPPQLSSGCSITHGTSRAKTIPQVVIYI